MLAELVKRRMDELHRSQADVARISGLSTGHVSDIVNGKRGSEASITTLVALAKGLDVSPSYFFSTDHSHMRVKRAPHGTDKRVSTRKGLLNG